MVDQHSGARADLAIDEPQAIAHEVRKRARGCRVPPRAALGPAYGREQPISRCAPGFNKGLRDFAKMGAAPRNAGDVKTGNEALVMIECTQRVHAALKTDVQVQVGRFGNMALQ